MAEEATTPVVADATKSVDQPTRPADAAEPAKDAEDKASGSGDVPADAPAEGSLCATHPHFTVTN